MIDDEAEEASSSEDEEDEEAEDGGDDDDEDGAAVERKGWSVSEVLAEFEARAARTPLVCKEILSSHEKQLRHRYRTGIDF